MPRKRSKPLKYARSNREKTSTTPWLVDAERARQLADIAASGDEDAAECAAADLAREFPPLP